MTMEESKIQAAIDKISMGYADNRYVLSDEIRSTILSCLRNTPAKGKEGVVDAWKPIETYDKTMAHHPVIEVYTASPTNCGALVYFAKNKGKFYYWGGREEYSSMTHWRNRPDCDPNKNRKPAPVENSGPVDDKAGMPPVIYARRGAVRAWFFPDDKMGYDDLIEYIRKDLVQPSSEGVTCQCGGYGYVMTPYSQPECCGCPKDNGECCGNAVDGTDWQPEPCGCERTVDNKAALSNPVQDGENSDVVRVPKLPTKEMNDMGAKTLSKLKKSSYPLRAYYCYQAMIAAHEKESKA